MCVCVCVCMCVSTLRGEGEEASTCFCTRTKCKTKDNWVITSAERTKSFSPLCRDSVKSFLLSSTTRVMRQVETSVEQRRSTIDSYYYRNTCQCLPIPWDSGHSFNTVKHPDLLMVWRCLSYLAAGDVVVLPGYVKGWVTLWYSARDWKVCIPTHYIYQSTNLSTYLSIYLCSCILYCQATLNTGRGDTQCWNTNFQSLWVTL